MLLGKLHMEAHTFDSRRRQVGLCEFKASLVYIVSSRLAWFTSMTQVVGFIMVFPHTFATVVRFYLPLSTCPPLHLLLLSATALS